MFNPLGYGAAVQQRLTEVVPGQEPRSPWYTFRRSVLLTCAVCLVVLAEGYDVGVLNGALVRLQADLGVSTMGLAMVVAVTPLFLVPGALFGSWVGDLLGRKIGLLFACSLLTLGPLGMALSPALGWLVAARGTVGFGIGMGFVIISAYVGEVAPAEMRGQLIALEDVFLNLGMLFGYLVSWLLLGVENDWRWMIAIGSILPFVFIPCVPLLPESPRWLFAQGQTAEAEEVLLRFMQRDEAAEVMKGMEKEKRRKENYGLKEDGSDWESFFAHVKDPFNRRALFAGIAVFLSQASCGYFAVVYYSSHILKDSMSESMAFLISFSMCLVKFLSCLCVVAVLGKAGRRSLILASIVATTIACLWIGFSFEHRWGPLAQAGGFSLFMAAFSLGLGPVPFVYGTEIFTTEMRAKSIGVCLFISRFAVVMSTFFFPLVVKRVGAGDAFFLQGAWNLVLLALAWLLVPESRGHSLESSGKIFGRRSTLLTATEDGKDGERSPLAYSLTPR